eukprot:345831-Lingulodinium_polyedra.AAC.1
MAPLRPSSWRASSTGCGRTQSSTTPSRRRSRTSTVRSRQPTCGSIASAFCSGSWATTAWATT